MSISAGQCQPYAMSITLVTLTAGATPTAFTPARGVVGFLISKNGGAAATTGGTLAIANGLGFSSANSYVLGDTEKFLVNGPSQFFLCAGGATSCVASVITYYSAGYSMAAQF